jgi:hypothetical protein
LKPARDSPGNVGSAESLVGSLLTPVERCAHECFRDRRAFAAPAMPVQRGAGIDAPQRVA